MLSRSFYLFALAAVASNAQEFDPTVELPTCRVIPFQDEVTFAGPTDASCSADPFNATLTEIEALAAKYAPVVYFAPLDNYTLADPMKTLEGTGKIVSGGTTQDTLDLSTLTDLTSSDQYLMHDLTDEYKAGEGFDAEGLSQATVYFSYTDLGNNVWAFNYYYYFTYVGLLTMGHSSAQPYFEFQVGPYGVHEGDWESISVMVCAGSDATEAPPPLAVHYYGLAQSSITDCTKGECSFYTGTTTHVVAFSALNHHAMYPFPSFRTYFGKLGLEVFALGSLFFIDVQNFEDANGNTRKFMPSADNVKWIDPSLDIWQYGGRWGESVDETISPDLNLVCTNEDSTAYETCPDNQVVIAILGLFDTITPDLIADFLDERLIPLLFNRALGDFGPLYWPNYDAWPAPELAPIWDTIDGTTVDDAAYCAEIGVSNATGGSVPTPSPTTYPPVSVPNAQPVSVPVAQPVVTSTEPTGGLVEIRVPNAQFEKDKDKWKVLSGQPFRECFTGNARTGDCAYAFYANAGEPQRIKNRLRNIPPGNAGDKFFLYYWVKGVGINQKRDFKVLFKPTAADGSNEKIGCKLTNKNTFDYEQMMCPFEPSFDYEYVNIIFEFNGSRGAIYLDWLDLFQQLP